GPWSNGGSRPSRFGRVATMRPILFLLLSTLALPATVLGRAEAEATPNGDALLRTLPPGDGFGSPPAYALDPPAPGASAAANPFLGPAAAGAIGTRKPSRWGFDVSLGTGGTGGDFGSLLKKPVTGDYMFFRSHDKWRFGLGLSFGSYTMASPHEDEPE